MDLFTPDELLVYLDCVKEQAFLICDQKTRETGKLVKMIIVVRDENVAKKLMR